jgi:hypothetical protein
MADSGQQPTADTDALVNEIFVLLAYMEIKRIDVSCERVFFQNLLRSLPTESLEVSAGRLQNFRTTLRTLLRNYRAEAEAAEPAADEPDGLTTSIAIGRKASPATPASPATHWWLRPCLQWCRCRYLRCQCPAGNFTMRQETLVKCEALHAFALAHAGRTCKQCEDWWQLRHRRSE